MHGNKTKVHEQIHRRHRVAYNLLVQLNQNRQLTFEELWYVQDLLWLSGYSPNLLLAKRARAKTKLKSIKQQGF